MKLKILILKHMAVAIMMVMLLWKGSEFQIECLQGILELVLTNKLLTDWDMIHIAYSCKQSVNKIKSQLSSVTCLANSWAKPKAWNSDPECRRCQIEERDTSL